MNSASICSIKRPCSLYASLKLSTERWISLAARTKLTYPCAIVIAIMPCHCHLQALYSAAGSLLADLLGQRVQREVLSKWKSCISMGLPEVRYFWSSGLAIEFLVAKKNCVMTRKRIIKSTGFSRSRINRRASRIFKRLHTYILTVIGFFERIACKIRPPPPPLSLFPFLSAIFPHNS